MDEQSAEVIKDVFEYLKKELRGVVGAPYLNYLERKYLTKRKEINNDR